MAMDILRIVQNTQLDQSWTNWLREEQFPLKRHLTQPNQDSSVPISRNSWSRQVQVRQITFISWTVILTKLLIFDEIINRYLI